MPNETILLRAEAKKLGVDGYRKMSPSELSAAIKSAKGKGSTPAKGKGKTQTSANGSKGKSSPAKGKGKTAPAKSTAQKSTSKGKSAASGTAKRPSAASAKGKGKASTARTPKSSAKASTSAKSSGRGRKNVPARVNIDRKQIDWKADTNVGKSGKRKDVMDALRKFKGDYDKTFEHLKANARKYYPGKTKHEAEGMLRWLINRVAYDFVSKSGQHESGQRAAYGSSDKPQDIRRREQREAARKEREKAERKAKREGKASSRGARTAKSQGSKGKSRTAQSPAKGKGKRR